MQTSIQEREFKVFVNGKRVTTTAGQLTGMQIKQLAHVQDNYEVFLFHGNECQPVADGQSVEVRDGEHFRAIPPVGFRDLFRTV